MRLYLIADFNAETLGRYLGNTVLPDARVDVAPFGPVIPALALPPPDPQAAVVIWTRPESIVEPFRRATACEEVVEETAIEDAKRYAAAVAGFARGVKWVFVPTWVMPPWHRGNGMLDWRPGAGLAHMLSRMNLALADALQDHSSVFVLDTARWLTAVGPRSWSQKLWYVAKCPFAAPLLEHAAWEIGAAIAALQGTARRLVIVDLDNLLWGGVVGEVGWRELNLGGHDHAGEAFAEFQGALKALTRRGVQLAIVSKNDEATAFEAIDRHPEMQLSRSDFAGWRINWNDKAQNVTELLLELGLGADSAVFIDDSAVERARVAAGVPGILVPDWPPDPARYLETLAALRCFDTPFLTAEDRARREMYVAERTRRTTLPAAGDLTEWLESLGVAVTVEPLCAANLDRASQLLNKTNQMNLSTRRLSKAQLEAWAAGGEHLVLTFRVADRFGDSGLTGLVGLAFDGARARLVDFVLSCRVMGRSVEDTMLHVAVAHSRVHGAAALVAEFQSTPRNRPCLDFMRRSRFHVVNDTVFSWDTSQPYDRPHWVTLHERAGLATVDR